MSLKQVLTIVMCGFLLMTIVIGGVVVSRIAPLFQMMSATPGVTQPSTEGTEPSGTESIPTESTEPTDPEHEHDYNQLIRKAEATCTGPGYGIYLCECGQSKIKDMVDPLGHDMDDGVVKAPTCTAQGATVYSCSRCTYTESKNPVAATGHHYEVPVHKDVTCTEDGYDGLKCRDCSAIQKDKNTIVTAPGHDFSDWITDPEDETKQTRECGVCHTIETQVIGGETEPTDPSEPSNPSEPSEPSEPTEPSEPSEPSASTDPSEPSEPSESTEPTEPSGSTEPSEPTENTEPTETVESETT